MNANITLTLAHETGRRETIDNVSDARTVDGTINIEYKMQDYSDDELFTDEYDAHSWVIVRVSHTNRESTEA